MPAPGTTSQPGWTEPDSGPGTRGQRTGAPLRQCSTPTCSHLREDSGCRQEREPHACDVAAVHEDCRRAASDARGSMGPDPIQAASRTRAPCAAGPSSWCPTITREVGGRPLTGGASSATSLGAGGATGRHVRFPGERRLAAPSATHARPRALSQSRPGWGCRAPGGPDGPLIWVKPFDNHGKPRMGWTHPDAAFFGGPPRNAQDVPVCDRPRGCRTEAVENRIGRPLRAVRLGAEGFVRDAQAQPGPRPDRRPRRFQPTILFLLLAGAAARRIGAASTTAPSADGRCGRVRL
jgi:hypothetical protein